ncbi:unnamed protein product [Blepharisma stoltei]|uniref:Uncharacterized protein n=1 Tax=Blepharisma stoltei TaxID=1481888 RepID=A0AAU9JQC3_9CILI|nr:unnamed protein product [Blepharisma stoltei]
MEEPENLLVEGNSCDMENHEAETNNQEEIKSQELLVMTVEIGDGRQDIIVIYENDDPTQLASDFAKKHSLDPSLQQSLAGLIRQNKELVEKNAAAGNQDPGKISDFFGSYSSTQNPKETAATQNPKPKKTPKPVSSKDDFKFDSHTGSQKTVTGSIYEKFTKQAKTARPKTASSVTSSQLPTSGNNPGKRNYGEWLYLKGLKQKETAKQKIESKKQAIEEKSAKELTFMPSINKTGSVASPRNNNEKLENYLLDKAKQYQEHLEQIKADVENEQMKECSFVPSISERKLKPRDYSKSIHEELFDQASRRKEKKLEQEMNSIRQFPFKPEVSSPRQKTVETKEEFVERLATSKLKFDEEMEEARKSLVVTHDESTGQKLFTPQTYSKVNRSADTPIWEHLYSLKDVKAKNINKEIKAQNEKLVEASSSTQKQSKNSKKYFDKFRMKQYERIFKLLDSDEDGNISAGMISLDGLDDKACEVMTPLFEKIEEDKITLDFASFVESMDELLKTLSVDEKAYILKREAKPEQEETKKPLISEMSIKLSEKSRGSLPDDIYERMVMTQELKRLKMVKEREERAIAEVKQCTFRPALRTR